MPRRGCGLDQSHHAQGEVQTYWRNKNGRVDTCSVQVSTSLGLCSPLFVEREDQQMIHKQPTLRHLMVQKSQGFRDS